ncbi:deoxyhypusine synthase [Methanosalsum zhilinae DSM 4017]|uniref:Probable deoxyhypusine synthase n=1 Tax=Methanosalsum zhilinae (strain DSM 4017 / NBRC 107636 / OCM 62 / WeN5) TaxID=679901 RepID=F7XLU3_METZD|nr:deoxyhypusine synthase [Methanosalsum zhilinae]AEH61087.1 deoxyhypusine synthase [Methanosalsum zhilinae DSM 4017]
MHIEEDHDKLRYPIQHARISPGMNVDELVGQMRGCAFGAGRLGQAVDIYCEMLAEDTTKFFGLAGAMVPAGMRCIISDLIRDGNIDVLVTTGANLVHDIIESLDLHHYKGTDAINDACLKNDEINRIYDVYLPEHHFTGLEEKLQSVFSELGEEKISIRQFLSFIGKNLDDDNSILKTAADHDVPVYCPAIQDCVIGLQAWLYKQINPLNVDVFADMSEFLDICYEAEKAGALLVGGGVPKNYIFQSMLVTPKEFDYAIQLTMDTPETGGLSGASLEEAISWGKVGEEARSVTVYSDATITLPIIVAAARSRLKD